jgi:flavodoxin
MIDNLILYASKGDSAKKVAEFLQDNLIDNSQIICVNNNVIKAEDFNFSLLILVCPTYGDEELETDMENFLIKSNWNNHRGKYFTVCELGLYRGYLETSQGAGILISNYLKLKGLLLRCNILSIDSMPLEDFSLIKKWSDALFE